MKIISIGKSKDCDIVLNGDTVSRTHAQLAVYDSYIEIIDLESTNGTFVNGKKIKSPTKLKTGDALVLGGELFDWEALRLISSNKHSGQESFIAKMPRKSSKGMYVTLGACAIILVISIFYFSKSEKSDTATNADQEDTTETEKKIEPAQFNFVDQSSTIEPGTIDYDFSCLENEGDLGTTSVLNSLGDLEKALFGYLGPEVTIAEEEEYGQTVLAETKTKDFGPAFERIEAIFQRLLNALPQTQYNYEIHLIDSAVINAHTIGGQIFVYQGIIDICENDDELAGIIAHEIAHNELGHLSHLIRQMKAANSMFEFGMNELTAEMYWGVTAGFGQKDETHCDLYGIDLAFKANFNACEIPELWERMSKDDNEYSIQENLFRTHPYSIKRSSCCQHHIETHHPNSCAQ